jgi:hypothetical protein
MRCPRNRVNFTSAFRAVRAALRSQEESAVPLSRNQGTTCTSFVAASLQAAVIQQAMLDDKLPHEAKEAIAHIKNEGLHLPGQATAMRASGRDKAERYGAISEQASEQIKRLMPTALQIDAKTTMQFNFLEDLATPGSGFDKVGYAKIQGDRIELLPESQQPKLT